MNNQANSASVEERHFDVLIVGAGVSGIAAAYHLQDELPAKTYAILEAREAIGGTWDLFRYPGIRSDSDLHTFGYAFKPWKGGKAIADGPAIRDYIQETARENRIDRHVQFGTRVIRAEWSSAEAVWTVEIVRAETGEPATLTSRWLFCASGYYRYDEGYTPRFEGRERFGGQIVHPQQWPEHLDYAGKRVLVIGSGATAVTLVPAMAGDAAHVTMLQRSPTYVLPVPSVDRLNLRLRRLFGEQAAYAITRRINVARTNAIYKLSRRYPQQMRRFIRWTNVKSLAGSAIDVDTHFNPKYDPWDQRLCAVPDGDLFEALKAGTASVVTDRIRTFTESGVELESGRELDADIIVTATGLNLQPMGGVDLLVDGEEVTLAETVAYKGLMLSDVPNFVFAIGYTNASWTLKVDLVCEYFCRLIAHADAHGNDVCVARLPEQRIELKPLLDFDAGYVSRSLDVLPKQGTQAPWHLAMDYRLDTKYLRHGPVTDAAMRFLTAAPARHSSDGLERLEAAA
jgi:cation diffusion facilitator CzcD-associated flavoprotein CzcO